MPVTIEITTGDEAVIDKTSKKGSDFKVVTDTKDKQWYVYDKDLFGLMEEGAKLQVSYDTSEFKGKTYYQITEAKLLGAAPGSPAATQLGVVDHTDTAARLVMWACEHGLLETPEDAGLVWLLNQVDGVSKLLADPQPQGEDDDIPFGEE